ncbi:MAG: hypothetical protein NTW29_22310 [Bacteroidetes bacterium]|nr:hypothetical protein [Bacteroidota bacterium]
MKKLLFSLCVTVLVHNISHAQNVGVGTTTPHASAALEISGTNKGVLIPRISFANRPAAPATGLLIYQTDIDSGFYYYNGTAWKYLPQELVTGSGNNGQISFWSGNNKLSGSQHLFWDTIATKLRIGLDTNGVNKLTVAGTGGVKISSTNPGSGYGDWIALNVGSADSSKDRLVAGLLNGVPAIGAHNNTLSAWKPFSISPLGGLAIGGTIVDTSAVVDIRSEGNDRGVLLPRLTKLQREAIYNPAQGLITYQTDLDSGFYFYKGTGWKNFSLDIAGDTGRTGSVTFWTGRNKIGSTDKLYWNENSKQLGIGTQTTTAPLTLSSNNIGSGSLDWIAASVGGQTGDRVVIGLYNGQATIGAHNNALNAWSKLVINPVGVVNFGSLAGAGNRLLAIAPNGDLGVAPISPGYVPRIDNTGNVVNSVMRSDANGVYINTPPNPLFMLYAEDRQLLADGDGQHVIYAFRNRDVQNDGTNYGYQTSNNGVATLNFWGDVYSFGTAGFSYNDFTRTGGSIGAYTTGAYWGSCGYRSSASITYGLFATSAAGVGAGRSSSTEPAKGIGGGFAGDLMGAWFKGDVMGSISQGNLFASYNIGNVITDGRNIELVTTAAGEKVPTYTVSSASGAKIYHDGTVQLVNGTVRVNFAPAFLATLEKNTTPTVTLTPVGGWANLYISEIDGTGFTISEANNGRSNISVNWIAVGTRLDLNNVPVSPEILNRNFSKNLPEVLFNENNRQTNGKPMWWDGQHLQYTTPPLSEAEKEALREKLKVKSEKGR